MQIYFLLHGAGNFESNPEGDEEYKNFFSDRVDEINELGPRTHKQLFGFLEEEVFGVKKEATAEQRRQKEFSAAQLQAIKAQAAREEAEEEGSGNKSGGDDQEGDK